jgi:hypothetical protein
LKGFFLDFLQLSGCSYHQKALKNGLLTNGGGENGNGIEESIINNPIEYQIAIVLYFPLEVFLRLDFIEPIVITTIAATITTACSMPKKRTSLSGNAVLK